MSEKVIELQTCDWAQQNGILVRKVQWLGRRGAPDRLFMANGLAVFIEFKSPTGKLSKIQEREIARLREAGMLVQVFSDSKKAILYLKTVFADVG